MLHRIYWYVWFAGTALFVLSWLGAVTPAVGWTWFAVACIAALLSYLPQRRGRRRGQDWAVLSRAMVEAKDHGYELAMDHLSQGGTVFYDGIVFAVRPGGEARGSGGLTGPRRSRQHFWRLGHAREPDSM